ncbi:MAG: epoxyqueuosine reductase QueH [Clostridiales bacterium]|nr:epoxyqueuosine reductase QueH [Clostridiales bacterium]
MNKINYAKETEKIIESRAGLRPKLLLHACCAPCSSACLEYLAGHFDITVLFYNPNISPQAEFEKRYGELQRLIKEMPCCAGVKVIDIGYDYGDFLKIAAGLENAKEGAERCFKCYQLRIEAAARLANELGCEYFCTTLTISPLKNSQKINEIGFAAAQLWGVKWLPSDFKKKNGFKRSVELSGEYKLYRQNYCGCVFSQKKD